MSLPNILSRLISTMAPVIHRAIVSRLANSPTFQHLAVTGTEAAEKTAKRAKEEVQKSAIYRTASYKAQEQMTKLKNSEAFKEARNSEGGQFVQSFKDNVVKELRRNKIL